MKANEIKVGGHYIAKVNGSITTVRVDDIRDQRMFTGGRAYDVTNVKTGRKTTFKSAVKFRKEVLPFARTAKTPAPTPTTKQDNTTADTVAAPSLGDNELRIMPLPTKAVVINNPIGMTPEQIISKCVEQAEDEQRSDPTTELVQNAEASIHVRTNEDKQCLPFDRSQQTSTEETVDTMQVLKPSNNSTTESSNISTSEVEHKHDNFPVSTQPLIDPGTQKLPEGGETGIKLLGLAANIATIRTTTSSGYKLTEEQEAILADNSQILVIEAGAGSGKTSTLAEKANVTPGKGQYTAFNSKLVEESSTKFPKSVPCNTIHSLAFRVEGRKHAHRLNGRRVMSSEIAAMIGLQGMTVTGADGNAKFLQAGLLASQVTRGLRNFCQSADKEIMEYHIPRLTGIDAEHSRTTSDMVISYLLPYAQKMWADKCDPNGKLPFTHDDYVKMWELGDPLIEADYVLLDEAQDTSPVMLSIMEQQAKRGTRIILVGDSNQQIYSWRGAINALAAFPDAPRLMLSKSFRFGQVIAEVANATLKNLREPTRLVMKGFEKINSRLDSVNELDAILCRSNAGAVSHLLDAIGRGKHPHLFGGGDDICSFLRGAGDLQRGKSTSHPELCCFNNWKEVQAYVKTDEGQDLQLMVKLIDKFKVDVLLKAISTMPEEKDADLIISTAHKSKGREWKKVKLSNDFKPLECMGDEEIRLLYVAATRAQHILDVESCPPYCGGSKASNDSWNGEGGELRRINIDKARKMSNEISSIQEDNCEGTGGVPSEPSKVPTSLAVSKDEHAAQLKAITASGINTWAKRNDKWLVRGKIGQTGTVEVKRKNGTSSQEKLKRVVWQDEEVALYEVTQ